jgi:type I restriction enzyme, S subunit
MTNWKTYKLGEVVDIKHGYAYKGEFFSTEPTNDILVTPGNFNIGGGFKADKYKYYNGETPENYVLNPGDVIVTMTDLSKDGDTLGYSAIVPEVSDKRFHHNQRIGLLQFKSDDFSKEFVYWLMRTKTYQSFVLGTATGTTVKHTAPTRIQEYTFTAPNLPTQRCIAKILSALDDKIELNRRMNQTLEQMAQTLFRQYFMDGIDEENLPEGWRIGKVADVIIQSKGSVNPSKEPDKVYLHYSIPAYDSTQRPNEELGHTILSSKFIVKSNSILFSKLNPRFPRIWNIDEVDESRAICSTELLVFTPKAPEWYSFSYLLLSSEEVKNDLVGKATGTSGSHQRVKPSEILELGSIIPPKGVVTEFETKLRPLLKKKQQNLREIATLDKTRDSLLPKLMSGKIDVMQTKPEELHEPVLS